MIQTTNYKPNYKQNSVIAERIKLIALLKEKYKETHAILDKSYNRYISYLDSCSNAELLALVKDASGTL